MREVRLDEEGNATVIVNDAQLSLAIGKEGQNARLAARLTGWRIDIRSESQDAEEAEIEYADGRVGRRERPDGVAPRRGGRAARPPSAEAETGRDRGRRRGRRPTSGADDGAGRGRSRGERDATASADGRAPTAVATRSTRARRS